VIHGRDNHPSKHTPTLSSLKVRFDRAMDLYESDRSRANEIQVADELQQIAELMYRAAFHLRHGERG